MLNHIAFLLGENRLLLIVDDFDYSSRGKKGQGNSAFILDTLQNWRDFPLNLLLTSSNLPTDMPEVWQNSTALRLGTLNRQESDNLVVNTAGNSIIYAPDALDELWNSSGGHPYLLQLLCALVFQAAKEENRGAVIDRDVKVVAELLKRDRSARMSCVTTGMHPAEHAVLSAIAHLHTEAGKATSPNGTATLDMVSRLMSQYRMGGQVVELQNLLHRLAERDFLQRIEDRYCFKSQLLEKWFITHHPLKKPEKAPPVRTVSAEETQAKKSLQSARLLWKNRQYSRALNEYERAYIAAPKLALQELVEARLAYGIQLEKSGDERAAAVEYGRILEIAPSMTKVRQHLSNIMLRWARNQEEVGEWTQALSLYQRASSISPDKQLSQYISKLRGLRQTKSNPAGFYSWIVQAYRASEWKRVLELARQFIKQFGELPEIIQITEAARLRRDMKRVPGGVFLIGSDMRELQKMIKRYAWESDLVLAEVPQREIDLEEFYIDQHPVTNAEYYEFLKATKHRPPISWGKHIYPADKANHPVTTVNWHDAQAYAEWVGKRLPTEAEWEKAARGTDGRMWPWGNEFDITRCNIVEGGERGTTPTGKYAPSGNSPYGISDMAGNVWEWVEDFYQGYDGYEEVASFYHGWRDRYGEKFRVLRGGSWAHYSLQARCAFRAAHLPDATNETVGFRCVVGSAPEIPDELDY